MSDGEEGFAGVSDGEEGLLSICIQPFRVVTKALVLQTS